MATGQAKPEIDAGIVKSEWLDHLNTLVKEVKGWAETSGWRTRVTDKTLSERRLGSYKVPVLLMEKDAVEVVLNPVARFVPGANGAVDLYRAPAYDDIAGLYLEGDRWMLHFADRDAATAAKSATETKTEPCNQETIHKVLDSIA